MSPSYRKFKKMRVVLGVLIMVLFTSPSWASSLLETPADLSPRSAKAVLLSLARAGDRLIAVGERGFALSSEDKGRSWQQAKVPVSVTLTSVYFVTPQKGWAVGHGGVVLSSEDGGRTWQKRLDGLQAAQIELEAAKAAYIEESRSAKRRVRDAEYLVKSGPDKPFLDVHFFDERRGLVVGAYGLIFATDDAGRTWRSLVGNVPNPMGMHLYGICEMGSDLYLVGEQGLVFRASGGSEQFERIATPYEGSFFGMVAAANGDLILYGLRGNALRSSDGGESWDWIEMAQPVTLTSGARLENGGLVLVNETGEVLYSNDDGQTFLPVQVNNPSLFTDVLQAEGNVLVTSGIRGTTRIELQKKIAGLNK